MVIGIDVGGTRVKGIAVASSGVLLAEETCPTDDTGDGRWIDGVRTVCARLRLQCPTTAAGLCAPGLAARNERSIAHMPGRLRGLEGLDWSTLLGLPTVVLNDAHAALLGEAWRGAARGLDHVVMLTLGTGVGGAAIVDGRLLRGNLGRAGHLGHISLDPDGAPDIVGTPGSLEDAIGDRSVAARTSGRFSATRDLLAAAAVGDAEAQAVWARSIRQLGAALAGLINVFDPQTVVIGGGIADAKDALFAPLRAALHTMEWRIGASRVALVPAQLGAQSGAFGAAYRALQLHSAA